MIPGFLGERFNIHEGMYLVWKVDELGRIYVEPIPAQYDWNDILVDWPIEKVTPDDKGRYDATESPDFHDWVING